MKGCRLGSLQTEVNQYAFERQTSFDQVKERRNWRGYILLKIHCVTKLVEKFAIEVLCVRHSVAAENPSVENSEGC
jgi:hypothetical protein